MPDALSDLEVHGRAAAMELESILDQLIEGFELIRTKDRAAGATDDDATLGGLLMVIDAGVPPPQQRPLLALAVRRLVDGKDD